MKIRNITGSRGEYYRKIGKKEWLEAMGKTALPKCQILGCGKDATDASHVLTSKHTNCWFLLPECHEHNEDESQWLDTKATVAENLVKVADIK